MLASVKLVFCLPSLVTAVKAVAAQCSHHVDVLAIDDAELTNPVAARFCMATPSSGDGVADDHHALSAATDTSHRRFCTFHTSGTTGAPKPVHSSHAEFAAFSFAAAAPYRLTADSRIFVATSHIFDPSAGMIFAAWAAGATVCLAPFQRTLQDLRTFVELTRATHACSTPSVWALYDLEDVAASNVPTTVFLGGEPMPASLIKTWLGLGVTLINTYGTTEATVYQFAYTIPREVASLTDEQIHEHALRLGAPFDGISCEVAAPSIDADEAALDLSAEGAEANPCGELILRGVQVGGPERWRGTSDDFHTGDLVRRAAGGLAFVGRADKQVKLDGRRVELGPIETAITRVMTPLVQRTVVLLVRKRLHAFCQMATTPTAPTAAWAAAHASAVRLLCERELPSYMLPAVVGFMSELPVTPNGKTDTRALVATAEGMEASANENASTEWAPTGWLRTVASCWAAELGTTVSRMSAESDFRALSGSSLVALRICRRLWHARGRRARTGGVFGEHMGAYSPVRLLSSPILGTYASMLADHDSSNDDDKDAGGADGDTGAHAGAGTSGDEVAGEGAPPAASEPSPASSKSALNALAVQTVGVDALELLGLLLQWRADGGDAPMGGAVDDLLLSAIHHGHCECASLLLRHGASPNAIGLGGISALCMAVQLKGSELAQLLLDHGANVKAVDDNQQSAVHHAARTGGGGSRCVEMLLQSWEDATAASQPPAMAVTAVTGATPVTEATGGACGDGGTGADGGACGSQDKWGRIPLHWATINGHRDSMVALVGAGSDIWQKDFQLDSSMDLAERRAECREWLNGTDGVDGARCDKLTLSMMKLMAAEA